MAHLHDVMTNTIRIYITDEMNRTTRVIGDLVHLKGKRKQYLQTRIGKLYRMVGDEGGHLIGTQFYGTPEAINVIPQNKHSNHGGAWGTLERLWVKHLKAGDTVYVEIDVIYEDDCIRPISLDTHWTLNGVMSTRTIVPNPL